MNERPVEAEKRQEFGHWEIDTVLGKKGDHEALMTLTEQKTRKEILFRLSRKHCESINAMIQCLRKSYGHVFPLVFKSITADNGSEFAELTQAVKDVETEIYFTHPYSSFERGTNERHNGLIRRFYRRERPSVPFQRRPSLMQNNGVINFHGRFWITEPPKNAFRRSYPDCPPEAQKTVSNLTWSPWQA